MALSGPATEAGEPGGATSPYMQSVSPSTPEGGGLPHEPAQHGADDGGASIDKPSSPVGPAESATNEANSPNTEMDVDIERPSTPPTVTFSVANAPQTPDSRSSLASPPRDPPRTPATSSTIIDPTSAASIYLSSPIRRTRHNALLSAGTMTPGRPSSLRLKHSAAPAFRPRPVNAGSSNSIDTKLTSSLSSAFPSGLSSSLGSDLPDLSPGAAQNTQAPHTVPNLPLQTLFMTPDQARMLTDLEAARSTLALSLEQGEQFRKAAQQFRSLANQLVFQQKLAQIDRVESEQRLEVETSIQKREIEKLVVDIMGYTDKSLNIEQIRRKLRRTKQRVKEMEELAAAKDRHIAELQMQLARVHAAQVQQHQQMSMHLHSVGAPGVPMPPHLAHIPPQQHENQLHAPKQQTDEQRPPSQSAVGHESQLTSQASSGANAATPRTDSAMSGGLAEAPAPGPGPLVQTSPDGKPRPPPINTQISSQQQSTEPLSALEVLASQVLSSGIQHKDGGGPDSTDGSESGRSPQPGAPPMSARQASVPLGSAPAMPAPPQASFGSSPYSSPYYTPFSPYAVPPQFYRPAPSSIPQFGSPEKRRRPSSSSTISALSDEDTLEEVRS